MKREQVRYEVQRVPAGAQLTFLTLGSEPRTLLQLTLGPRDANRLAAAVVSAALSFDLAPNDQAFETIKEWTSKVCKKVLAARWWVVRAPTW